jgi:hypothetical protein
MEAQIANQPNFHIESIPMLFELDFPNFSNPLYDVSPEGQWFVVITADLVLPLGRVYAEFKHDPISL